ncbi:MAG TPA: hypothetical protein VN809_04410 [Telmatospirillum sp.]|nr:hypothetical protein [Telmatospirillum sp.]
MEQQDHNSGFQQIDEPLESHGHRCRDVVVLAVRAFLDLLDTTATGDTISVDAVRRIAHAVMNAEGALSTYYDLHAMGCAAFFELVKSERKRTDFYGRVITEPLVPLLNDPTSGIERKNLPQFFSAVRMILGDDVYTEYRDRCIRVANELRGGSNLLLWPEFFLDRRTLDILEETLVTIAHSFKRFTPRMDWFLIVMNTDPKSVSLGSTMFIQRNPDEKLEHAFVEANFVRLFRALFAAVHPEKYDKTERAAFKAKYGAPPETVFGPLFVELAMLDQRPVVGAAKRSGPGIETRKGSKRKP